MWTGLSPYMAIIFAPLNSRLSAVLSFYVPLIREWAFWMQGAYLVHLCILSALHVAWHTIAAGYPLCWWAHLSTPSLKTQVSTHMPVCTGEHMHGLVARASVSQSCHTIWWEQYTISSIILPSFHLLFSLAWMEERLFGSRYWIFYFYLSFNRSLWRIIASQYCVSFCCTTKWISHMHTYIPISPPSWVSLPPSLL